MNYVAGKKGQDQGVKAETKFLRNFIRDIKHNGIAYIKSEVVANRVKAFDPKVQITWNKEDKTYTAFYNE